MKKIIFWDWAGTLADESRLDKAVCRSIEEEISKKENISPGEAEKTFTEYLKKLENTWEWHDYVRHGNEFGLDWKALQERNMKNLYLLPHTEEILHYTRNKGYKNILTTNAVREVARYRLAHASLLPLLDTIIASDDVKALKSEGKHFVHGLRVFNGASHLSYSVGNNPVQDIIPAKMLKLRTILCEFGEDLTHYHSPHISDDYTERVKPDYKIQNLLEIKNII